MAGSTRRREKRFTGRDCLWITDRRVTLFALRLVTVLRHKGNSEEKND
jgi:hypothetical protein